MADRFMWPHRTGQKGAGMVEVLVAIVVFSFGMLGLASLQTAAFKGHHNAWARENVSTLTADLGERIRSNPMGARYGAYRFTPAYSAAGAPQDVAQSPDCARALLPARRASCDLHAVHHLARRRLPGGFINVSGDDMHGMRITVMWTDKDRAASGTICAPMQSAGAGSAGSTAAGSTAAGSTAAGATAAGVTAASGSPSVAQNCCPSGVPEGVRCFNSSILP